MKAAVVLCLALGLQSQTPAPKIYSPDLKLWRLEVSPDLGGWVSDSKVELRIKLVDPKDPNPPKDAQGSRYSPYDEEEGYDEGGDEQKTPDQLRRERLAREQAERLAAWRQRTVKAWFNGVAQQWSLHVGTTFTTELAAQNGENRLEILEPDSGLRVVRSWWVSTSRTRLRILTLQSSGEYVSGSLQVVEPDGALAEGGRRTASGGMLRWSGEYTHDTPPPGTYTLRWTGGYRGGKPTRLKVEAVLDGGTDQERRWTFERLMLPGAGPVTLGTVDVEP
jgi:hypothetical protein